jgi:hypothetical protein
LYFHLIQVNDINYKQNQTNTNSERLSALRALIEQEKVYADHLNETLQKIVGAENDMPAELFRTLVEETKHILDFNTVIDSAILESEENHGILNQVDVFKSN